MAIDKKALRTRSITAAVFAFVMLAGLFIDGWSFLVLFTIILFGCLYEVTLLAKKIWPRNVIMYILLTAVYIILPLLLLVSLGFVEAWQRGENIIYSYSPLFPVAIILSIWINDTMAYIVGSMIGKTPFSPISPKKTWEGTIGGAILCVVVMAILGSTIPFLKIIALKDWILIAALAAIAGTAGDLFESKLKRLADVKDSGSFMPGHGGFLDRFDSLLFAAPVVWLYVRFVMGY